MVPPLWSSVAFLIIINVFLPHDPQISLLVIYSSEMKTYIDKILSRTQVVFSLGLESYFLAFFGASVSDFIHNPINKSNLMVL